jgi:hypothetical protein
MLDTFSRTVNVDLDVLAAAIDAMSDCAPACRRCEQACRALLDALR